MSTQLFNVKDDPRQLQDRSRERPDIVKRLARLATEFLKSIEAPEGQFERLALPMR